MKSKILTLLAIAAFTFCFSSLHAQKIHEWRIYTFNAGGSTAKMDKLMTEILLPAYRDMGVKVGCFRDYGLNQPAMYYYLFEYPSFEVYLRSNEVLLRSESYVAAMKEDAASPRPMFFRYDSYLCRSFEKWPEVTPMSGKTIIEWRKYDSANIEANMRKVDMFNNGEIDVFLESGLNPLSFGQIIAGKDMPALIYTVQFDDMEDGNAVWRKFSANPAWAAMRDAPRWANAMNQTNRVYLTPLPYSPMK